MNNSTHNSAGIQCITKVSLGHPKQKTCNCRNPFALLMMLKLSSVGTVPQESVLLRCLFHLITNFCNWEEYLRPSLKIQTSLCARTAEPTFLYQKPQILPRARAWSFGRTLHHNVLTDVDEKMI